MNGVHTPEHEALIEAVLVGDRSRDDAEVRERLEACTACSDLLEKLMDVSRTLDDLRETEESALGAAGPASTAPWTASRVAAALDAARTPAKSAAGRGVWLAFAAAAAVVLIVSIRASRTSGERTDTTEKAPAQERYLGARRIQGVEPRGAVADYGTFRWMVAPEYEGRASTFVVRVRGGSADSAFSLESRRIRGNEWTPTKEELESMPDTIRWEVTAFDASGSFLDSDVQRASRSPH